MSGRWRFHPIGQERPLVGSVVATSKRPLHLTQQTLLSMKIFQPYVG